MDVGILGGTFDPIHLGHLKIADEARLRLGLDQVIFVPAGQPWLKVDRAITLPAHRTEMVRRAIVVYPYFEISTIEVDRPGPSYAVDTLAILQKQLGIEAKLFFLLGWDSLSEIPRWREPSKLIQMCQLVVVPRPGFEQTLLDTLELSISGIAKNVILLDMPYIDISSTDIRGRVAQGLSIKHLVSEAVESYIEEYKLYR